MNTTVLKVFSLSAVLSATLFPFIYAEVALGPPSPKASKSPVVSRLDIDNPICYMQRANGSTVDLSNLCGAQAAGTNLSEKDQKFLDSYNNSLSAYQEAQVLVTPDAEKDPQSTIKIAQGVCSALKRKVSLDEIQKSHYERIIETEDPRRQKIAVIEAEIIDSLATKIYCPEFAS